MPARRTTSIALLAAVTGNCFFASLAQAEWDDGYRHRWQPHDGWTRPGVPPALIVTPQSSDPARATAYEAPPPVAYTPPPAPDETAASFGLTVR